MPKEENRLHELLHINLNRSFLFFTILQLTPKINFFHSFYYLLIGLFTDSTISFYTTLVSHMTILCVFKSYTIFFLTNCFFVSSFLLHLIQSFCFWIVASRPFIIKCTYFICIVLGSFQVFVSQKFGKWEIMIFCMLLLMTAGHFQEELIS